MTSTKTEPSQSQKLVEEIARLKFEAHECNTNIGHWRQQAITAENRIWELHSACELKLQQAAAKEAELKRLLETLEP